MPIRRRKIARKRTTTTRRPYRKKRYGNPKNRITTSIVRGISAFPDTMQVKLKYAAYYAISGASGALGYQLMRGNDITDPDYTGIGDQPMCADQWSVFYEKFMVKGSSIKVTFMNETSNVAMVSIMPKTAVTTSSGPALQAERQGVKYKLLQGTSGAASRATIKDYRSTSKMFGIKKGQLGLEDDDFAADYGSVVGSDNQWYWHIYVQDPKQTSTVNIGALVEMVYYVTWFKRKPTARS